MSLAEITARIAGELADLRAQDVAVRRELDRLAATLAARDARIDALGAELEAALARLEATARRLDSVEQMADALRAERDDTRRHAATLTARLEAAIRETKGAQLERAGAERQMAEVRVVSDALRHERDQTRRIAWSLTERIGAVEAALAGGLLRQARRPQPAPDVADPQVIAVALGLERRALGPIVRMVRDRAAETPILLVIDHDLDHALDPAPARWLRLPRPSELPRRLAPDRADYLRARLGLLIELLRPAVVVPIGSTSARLLDRGQPASGGPCHGGAERIIAHPADGA